MNYYYSAAVKIKEGVTPIVGMKIRNDGMPDLEKNKAQYIYLVQRYFCTNEIFAFGEIDEKSYNEKLIST